jgi:hypothetical protein
MTGHDQGLSKISGSTMEHTLIVMPPQCLGAQNYDRVEPFVCCVAH